MAILNRASVSEEWYDVTSQRMLVAPEPQYLFAYLAKLALSSALMLSLPAGGAGITPARAITDQAGQAPAAAWQQSARLQLAQPDASAASAIVAVPEIGKAPGHTVRINRPRYGSGGFTLAAREITSGTQISTTPVDFGSEQVSITLKRYGGPYDATVQNAVAPIALDKFDLSVSLRAFTDYVVMHMQRDIDKWLDGVVSTFMGSGSTTLWPTGFSSDSTSTIAGDMPADIDLLFRGVETLKNASIPVFPDGAYRAVLSPTQARQLKADPQSAGYIRYDINTKNPVTGTDGAFIGKIAGVNCYESTTLPSTVNGNSITITTGIMYGPGMLGVGVGQLPRIAFSTADNYGEHALLIWLTYMAWNLLDSRFALQLHTS